MKWTSKVSCKTCSAPAQRADGLCESCARANTERAYQEAAAYDADRRRRAEQERQERARQEQEQAKEEQERTSAERTAMFDPHAVLGVRPGATQEEIRRAYRDGMVKYHPDKVAHPEEELQKLAKQKAQELNRAYEMLGAR